MGNCLSYEPPAVVEPNRHKLATKANFVGESFHEGELEKNYEIVELLGVGSVGRVSSVRKKNSSNKRLYALKTLRVDRVVSIYHREMEREIAIIRNLDHPNIVKAYDVFREPGKIHLVMDLCSGGDLYKRAPYTEKQSAFIMGKILSAVAYLHSPPEYMHRDLKFENIMFKSEDPESEPCLIDFGLSTKLSPGNGPLTAIVGSHETMAPEVRDGKYTAQADMWSLGIIACMILTGKNPGYSSNLNGVEWRHLSPTAKHFCEKLLKRNPTERMTAKQAQRHPWIKMANKSMATTSSSSMSREPVNNYITRQGCSAIVNRPKIRTFAMLIVAHHSSIDEIADLTRLFNTFDTDNSGFLSREQFNKAIRQSGLSSEEDINQLWDSMDVYGDGQISYTEFLAAAMEARGNIEEERIAEAFRRMDRDNSGYISKENLFDLLGRNYSAEHAEQFISEIDTSKDGVSKFLQ